MHEIRIDLVALEAFKHEGQMLTAGRPFKASPVDAKFYKGVGMAEEPRTPSALSAVAAVGADFFTNKPADTPAQASANTGGPGATVETLAASPDAGAVHVQQLADAPVGVESPAQLHAAGDSADDTKLAAEATAGAGTAEREAATQDAAQHGDPAADGAGGGDAATEDASGTQAAEEGAAAAGAPASRRRGRPSNAERAARAAG